MEAWRLKRGRAAALSKHKGVDAKRRGFPRVLRKKTRSSNGGRKAHLNSELKDAPKARRLPAVADP